MTPDGARTVRVELAPTWFAVFVALLLGVLIGALAGAWLLGHDRTCTTAPRGLSYVETCTRVVSP